MGPCFTPEAPRRVRPSSIRDGRMEKRKIDESPSTPTALHSSSSPSPSFITRRSPLSGMVMKRRKIDSTPSPTALHSRFGTPSPSSSFNRFSPSTLTRLSFLTRNFITIAALGEGDFGLVKRVQRRDSEEEYALKISKVDVTKVKTGLHYTKDHLKEILTHSTIPSHPNLVYFHQAWKEGGHAYLLMELCLDSLDGYWRKKNELELEEIQSVLNDMLRALLHLSSLNIAHLDVKPHNILKATTGAFKLADFGTAVDLTKDPSPEEFGDGRYAAPEILDGVFTTKADLFSLAISVSQVSVSSDSPLSSDEWYLMKEGQLPDRVEKALSGAPEMVKNLQSMLLNLAERPSAKELLKDELIPLLDQKTENDRIRYANCSFHRDRLSLSSSVERKMRENKSPLKSDVVFHTEKDFFEMDKPKTRKRASMRVGRVPKFELDD